MPVLRKIIFDIMGWSMNHYFWDTQIDYLTTTRKQIWNDDYFEFLVKSVWKLNSPRQIVDFGCGYGYLGMKLLPLLPLGSTYTGIDMGKELLNEARRLFQDSPFKAEFICADLRNYVPEKQYDIAVCQAVLRHIPQSQVILKKMVDSVTSQGMVICIEVNRRMENAGIYVDGMVYNVFGKDTELKEQWEIELKNGGRDFMTGSKVPIYMEQLGSRNVGVRINDFVDFISPFREKDRYKERIETFLKSNELERPKESEAYISALQSRSLLISYGTK